MSRRVFEVRKSEANKPYFVLVANNGEIILTSEEYESKQGCEKGIASVKTNALRVGAFSRFVGNDGQYYFNMIAANYEVIGVSEGYTNRVSREVGILSVRLNAQFANTIYV